MSGGNILYFGYGSNLDWDDWKAWCERMKYPFEGLIEVGPCWLPDYSMKFHYFSRGREGGAADVEEIGCGHAVPGVLFQMDATALEAMDRKEGVNSRSYERRLVNVCLPDGTLTEALTYCVTSEKKQNRFVHPTEAYIQRIETGLLKRKLPIGELKNAIVNFTPSFPLNSLFVYGTLMQGEIRNLTLKEHCLGSGESATATGTLVDLGAYPGMLAGLKGTIHGELYQTDQVFEALQALDRVEGFYGYDSVDSLYVRTIVQVQTERGPKWAWTYIYNAEDGETHPVIKSGNWRQR
jgi:gamma-glutamylcyclotransferase (GGCT)/AIG2-like uncharacterized protein YtfP